MAERRFERHARTVTLWTILSRISGLARDATLSRVFGAGILMDAFFFAFLIPNLFRRLFGEGALAAAFLPVYSELDRSDPEIARRLASLTVARLTVVLGAVVLIGEIVLFILSQRAGHANIAIWLTMLMLPYMPMICLVAVLGAMLQVHGRFGPTAAAPAVLNLLIVAAALGGAWLIVDQERDRVIHIGIVAGSVIVAGVVQVLWSLAALRTNASARQQVNGSMLGAPESRPVTGDRGPQSRSDAIGVPSKRSASRLGTPRRFAPHSALGTQTWWTSERAGAGEPFRRIMRQAGPMILGLGVLQVNTLFDGLIASYPTVVGPTIAGVPYPLDEGAMASVSFAQRLYQFPLGVFGIAVATAIFPLLALLKDDAREFADALRRGLRLVVFIGLPASIGLILVREPLTAVILQGGDFTAEDTRRVGFILFGYAPAIWAYSMIHVLTRAFYARGDAARPVRIALAVVGLNLILNCTLIWTPLREAGLAWSTAICSVLQVILLLRAVRGHAPGVVDRAVAASWLRTAVLTAVMAGAVLAAWMLAVGAAEWLAQWRDAWSASVVLIAMLVGSGAAVVAAGAAALRMPELTWALGRRA